MSTARVNFFEGQFLRPRDFTDNQRFHIDAQRQHDARMHVWGIVEGLQLLLESGRPVLAPGKASDGFGREMIVEYPVTLDVDQFGVLGTEVLDVRPNYDRQPVKDAALGCAAGLNVSRWLEQPRVEMRSRDEGSIDPRRPPGVPDRFFDGSTPFEAVDDPKVLWRVFLGQVRRDMSKPEAERYSINSTGRPYAGVVAATVDHPADASRIQLGEMDEDVAVRYVEGQEIRYMANADRRFAVFLADDLVAGNPLFPRMEIVEGGEVQFHGPVRVEGNLAIQNGAVEFLEQASINPDCRPEDPAIYRWTELAVSGGGAAPAPAPVVAAMVVAAPGSGAPAGAGGGGMAAAAAAAGGGPASAASSGPTDALRIDLGSITTRARSFEIGFSGEDGKFVSCLTLEPHLAPTPGAIVRLAGDLRVAGKLNAKHFDQLRLSDDARNALLSPFLIPPV